MKIECICSKLRSPIFYLSDPLLSSFHHSLFNSAKISLTVEFCSNMLIRAHLKRQAGLLGFSSLNLLIKKTQKTVLL